MKYIITQTQFHKLVYKFLDKKFSDNVFELKQNPLIKFTKVIDLPLYSTNGKKLINVYVIEDDSNLTIHPDLIEEIRDIFSIRSSKVMDIVGDWISEKLNINIEEVDIGEV